MSSSDKKVIDAGDVYQDDYICFNGEKISVAELAKVLNLSPEQVVKMVDSPPDDHWYNGPNENDSSNWVVADDVRKQLGMQKVDFCELLDGEIFLTRWDDDKKDFFKKVGKKGRFFERNELTLVHIHIVSYLIFCYKYDLKPIVEPTNEQLERVIRELSTYVEERDAKIEELESGSPSSKKILGRPMTPEEKEAKQEAEYQRVATIVNAVVSIIDEWDEKSAKNESVKLNGFSEKYIQNIINPMIKRPLRRRIMRALTSAERMTKRGRGGEKSPKS